MLKKLVNGNEIVCSNEEEKFIRKQWALNDAYPEYSGHLLFDGISEPIHNIIECKKHHRNLISKEINIKIQKINQEIENAEDNNDSSKKKELIEQRKKFKEILSYDDSLWSKIEHLADHLSSVRKVTKI